MAKKKEPEVNEGLPAWMGTYGDMVTLLLCFFVLLFSMSSVDAKKFKEALAPFNNRMDVLPGGRVLTEGESLNNGVNQMDDIQTVLDKAVIKKVEKQKEYESESDSDKEKEKEMSEAELEMQSLQAAKEVYEKVDAYLKDAGIREEISMKYSPNYVKLILPGEALFDPLSAGIKPDGQVLIDSMSDVIGKEEFKEFDLQIDGHTDNLPTYTEDFASNWELSTGRAISVGKYLISTQNVSENRVACTGYGEYRPVADNSTPEGRAKNRRVEIKLILSTEDLDVKEYGEGEEDESPLAKEIEGDFVGIKESDDAEIEADEEDE